MPILKGEQEICAGAEDHIREESAVARDVFVNRAIGDGVGPQLSREHVIDSKGGVEVELLRCAVLHLRPAANVLQGAELQAVAREPRRIILVAAAA